MSSRTISKRGSCSRTGYRSGATRAPRGIRALGVLRKRPAHNASENWWVYIAREQTEHNSYFRFAAIPRDWFALAWDRARDRMHEWFGYLPSRRAVEDVAATAFARLPPERRAELLAATPPDDRSKPKKAVAKKPAVKKPKRKT